MLRPIRKFGVLFAALLFLAGAIAAQDRYGGSMDAKEHGYQHGYRDGLRQGRADLSRNAAHSFDTEDYRHADQGYDRRMGEHDDFQQGYRNGYKDGYDDGYYDKPVRHIVYGLNDSYDPDRVPRSDADADAYANWSYQDVATDTGYRDGLQAGLSDLRAQGLQAGKARSLRGRQARLPQRVWRQETLQRTIPQRISARLRRRFQPQVSVSRR